MLHLISAADGLNEQQRELQRTVSEFAQKELLPNMRQWDEEVWSNSKGGGAFTNYSPFISCQEVFPVQTLRAAAQLGLGGECHTLRAAAQLGLGGECHS